MAYDTEANPNAEDALFLQRVRDVIVERGWTRGTLCNPEGAVCILGAAGVVDQTLRTERLTPTDSLVPVLDSVHGNETVIRLARALGVPWAGSWGKITGWNDSPGRTVDGVLKHIDDRITELTHAVR